MDLKNQTQKRTIKFRGLRTDGKGWVYGGYFQHTPDEDGVRYYIFDFNEGAVEVIPESVGQFTGCYDKNGKEIYEGDILKTFPIISSDKIAYDSFNVLVKFINSSWIANGVLGKRQAEISEVIGSINENPELLENKFAD